MTRQSNVRLFSRVLHKVDSHWHIAPDDPQGVARAFRLLAEYQTEEPSADWRLETRGEVSDWHEWRLP